MIILFYPIGLFQFFIYQLFKHIIKANSRLFIKQIFIEHFLYISTVLESGDIMVNKTMSCFHKAYILRDGDDNQTNKQRNMQDKKN